MALTRRTARTSAGEGPGRLACLARRNPQAKAHRRATLRTRLRDDRAILGGCQAADDVQPDPHAAEAPAVAGLPLDEPLEDPLVVAWRDADPLVLDGDLDHRTGDVGAHGDAAASRGVLEGVLQQLAHDDVGRHRVAE